MKWFGVKYREYFNKLATPKVHLLETDLVEDFRHISAPAFSTRAQSNVPIIPTMFSAVYSLILKIGSTDKTRLRSDRTWPTSLMFRRPDNLWRHKLSASSVKTKEAKKTAKELIKSSYKLGTVVKIVDFTSP